MQPSVKFEAPLLEGVRAAAGNVVLLEHQHALAALGQQRSSREATHTAADDDCIDLGWHLFRGVAILEDGKACQRRRALTWLEDLAMQTSPKHEEPQEQVGDKQ